MITLKRRDLQTKATAIIPMFSKKKLKRSSIKNIHKTGQSPQPINPSHFLFNSKINQATQQILKKTIQYFKISRISLVIIPRNNKILWNLILILNWILSLFSQFRISRKENKMNNKKMIQKSLSHLCRRKIKHLNSLIFRELLSKYNQMKANNNHNSNNRNSNNKV